jgi:uncharacterized protein YlxP (DUF503 family)
MVTATARLDLRVPGCGSLKAKRHVVKSLTAALRSRFNVSVAEVDHHDLWQRTALGVAAVDREQYHVRKVMQQVERFVESWAQVDVISIDLDLSWPEQP